MSRPQGCGSADLWRIEIPSSVRLRLLRETALSQCVLDGLPRLELAVRLWRNYEKYLPSSICSHERLWDDPYTSCDGCIMTLHALGGEVWRVNAAIAVLMVRCSGTIHAK